MKVISIGGSSKTVRLLTPEEREREQLEDKAALYSRLDPLTHYPALSTRWAWQRTLVDDAEQTMDFGPVLRMFDVISLGDGKLEEWPGICLEVFSHLYGDVPRMLEQPSMLGVSLFAWLESTETWSELRRVCKKKRAVAMATTASVCRGIAGELFELHLLSKDRDKAKSPDKVVDEAQALLDAGSTPEKVAKMYDPLLKKSQQRREDLIEKLDMQSGLGAAKARAWFEFLRQLLSVAQELGDLTGVLHQAGLGPSASQPDDPVSLELLKALQALPNLKELVRVVGRMKREAKGEPAPSRIRIRPDGIHQSQTDLLLSEYALADAAPDLWYRRFLDIETLGMRRVGEEPQAEGDLVIVVDDSGSMMGDRRVWAHALAVALVLEALTAERRCLVAIYSDVSTGDYADCQVMDARDLPRLFKMLAKVYGNGTETRAAVLRAASKLTAPLREPDILLITDGAWEQLHPRDWPALKGPDGKGRLYVLLLAPYGAVVDVAGATRTWAIKELDIETTKQVLSAIKDGAPAVPEPSTQEA